MSRFPNRAEAGRRLAEKLDEYAGRDDVVVLALPRGGVAVGFEVAKALRAPLDVYLVRKLGVPGHEELAMGAIASGGVRVLNREVLRATGIPNQAVERVAAREQQELQRREQAYRGDRPPPQLEQRAAILVDDGLATGATMRAAVGAVRQQHPAAIVVATPTGSRSACAALEDSVDGCVCLITPEPFYGVGAWYEEFPQLTDEEVRDLLRRAQEELPAQ
ncbi:MAG: phosphoribosyltransferase [bacterium]